MDKSPARKLAVRFYKTGAGNEPVKDWLKKLKPADRQLISEDIKTVEIGWPLGMPLVKKMAGRQKLWEIRSNISHNQVARVLFTVKGQTMLLLHGFIKKSQATPKADLDLASKRAKKLS